MREQRWNFGACRILGACLTALVLSMLFTGGVSARICGDNINPYPTCIGDCFVANTMCARDSSGAPVCECEPRPCDLAFAPQCNGPCQDPAQTCKFIASTNQCRCNPVLDCGSSTAPQCNGPCQNPGEACHVTQLNGALVCHCDPIHCEQSVAPQCSAPCAIAGQTCSFNSAQNACTCNPPVPCPQSVAPECNGICPAASGLLCKPNTTGTPGCNCQQQTCEQSPYPTCNGICPNGLICHKDATGLAQCTCQTLQCDRSPFPNCNGACQTPGAHCIADPATNNCHCDPPPPTCGNLQPFPTCKGECPTGKLCVPDSAGTQTCDCEPIPCDLSDPLTCNGVCTNGLACKFIASDDKCSCTPVPKVCDQTTPYPACNADCPTGSQCVANSATGHCNCEPITCEQSPYPGCTGPCPATAPYCAADPTGATGCRCQPTPCELTPVPTCNGPCKDPTQTCQHITNTDGTPDECRCQPPVDCAGSVYPLCDQPCPNPSQLCVPGSTMVPPIPHCVCEDKSCEQQVPPFETCSAPCPIAGQVCQINAAGNKCTCTPPPTACENLPIGAVCNGTCTNTTDICLKNSATQKCECKPKPCNQTPSNYPVCDGACPSGTYCSEDQTTATCSCKDKPCEQQNPAIGETCNGPCNFPGQTCQVNAAGKCKCQGPPQCDDTTPYPTCSAPCPPGMICVPDPITQHCRCIPKPCEQTPYPSCIGPCPLTNQKCTPIDKGNIHLCRCTTLPCVVSPFPTCGGTCDPGFECIPTPAGCQCKKIPPPVCAQTFPTCGGTCPINSSCRSGFTGGCLCCPNGVIPTGDIVVSLGPAKTLIKWIPPNPCHHWFNVYRAVLVPKFVDNNHDGIPDNGYGTCFKHDITALETDDTSTPPPGRLFAYLVTGENPAGEGSLGKTSAGLERPNIFPCP
jgi:hypothetical protein